MRKATGQAVILAYHRLAQPETDVHGLCLSPNEFRQQMRHLQAEYSVTSLEALAAAVRDGSVPDRSVAITFDDGYLDNYTVASPILLDLGLPATFFVTTDGLDRVYEYWWDAIERIFCAPGDPLPDALNLSIAGIRVSMPTLSPTQRGEAHRQVHGLMSAAAAEARDAALAALAQWSQRQTPTFPAHRRMNADELRVLSTRPAHDIGAHTARHLMLPAQHRDVQLTEILEAQRCLQALLGKPVAALAYPYGAVDEPTCAVARASFACAVTCEGVGVSAGADLWRLPRVEVRTSQAEAFPTWLQRRFDTPAPDATQPVRDRRGDDVESLTCKRSTSESTHRYRTKLRTLPVRRPTA
jgi:peptidoglycan/xylan/chitin deacetylase (PgdA/CDA1 family)